MRLTRHMVTPETPLRLEIEAQLAFPDGAVTAFSTQSRNCAGWVKG